MADNSISQVTSTVKENTPIHVEFLNEITPAVLSTEVALRFQKKHKHVLDEIHKIISITPKSFHEPNFRPMLQDVKIGNGAVRQSPAYLLTRDAFSLLVMGFTGAAAVRWKLKYIEAFNALEAAALDHKAELAREAGYRQGRDEALGLPAVQAQRQEGYLAGLQEGRKYRRKHDGLALLTRALGYRQKGLNQNEIARLLGIRQQLVSDLLARAKKLGVAL